MCRNEVFGYGLGYFVRTLVSTIVFKTKQAGDFENPEDHVNRTLCSETRVTQRGLPKSPGAKRDATGQDQSARQVIEQSDMNAGIDAAEALLVQLGATPPFTNRVRWANRRHNSTTVQYNRVQ